MVKEECIVNGLSKNQIDVLRDLLMKKKNELVIKQLSNAECLLTEEDRSDEIDFANADAANTTQINFRNRDNFYEKKIDDALVRLEGEKYGLCDECVGPIGFLRLYARPTANLCILCKEEAER